MTPPTDVRLPLRAFSHAAREHQSTRSCARRSRPIDFRDRLRVGKLLAAAFDWFGEDFEKATGSVAAFVAGYVEHTNTCAWLLAGPEKTERPRYDWGLNAQPEQRPLRDSGS